MTTTFARSARLGLVAALAASLVAFEPAPAGAAGTAAPAAGPAAAPAGKAKAKGKGKGKKGKGKKKPLADDPLGGPTDAAAAPAKDPKADAVKVALFPLAGGASAKDKAAVLAALKAELGKSGRTPTTAAAPFEESAAMIGCTPTLSSCLVRIGSTLAVTEMMYGQLDEAAAAAPAAEPAPAVEPEPAADDAAKGKGKKGKGKKGKPKKGKPKVAKGKKAPPMLHLKLVVANHRGATLATQELDLPGGKGLGKTAKATAKAVLARATEAAHGKLLVKSDPEGARVVVDGVERGVTPVELELETGGHTVDAISGTAEASRSVEVTPGGGEVLLDLTKPAAAAAVAAAVTDEEDPLAMLDDDPLASPGDEPPPPKAVDKPADPAGGSKTGMGKLTTPTFAAVGAGAGLLAIGAVFGVLTVATHARFEDDVAALTPPLTEAGDLATLRDLDRMGKRGKTLALLADVLLIGGGIALVGGGVLAWRDLSRGSAATSAPAASGGAGAARAKASVTLLPGGAALSVEVPW